MNGPLLVVLEEGGIDAGPVANPRANSSWWSGATTSPSACAAKAWSEAESGGRVVVTVHPQNAGIPGSDPQALEMLCSSELEFMTLMGGILGRAVPVAEIQGLPFAFTSFEHVHAVDRGPLGELITRECRAKGIHRFAGGLLENGFRHIGMIDRPIRAVADLVGVTMRVPDGQMFRDLFEALEARPVTVNINQLYDALATHRALRVEYEAIVKSGFILQLDCPDLARERHNTYQDRPLRDFLQFAEMVVAAINRKIQDLPRERVRMHVCWGNYEGPHDCDVPLDEIVPVLGQAKVGGFLLTFANPRHAHGYRYLKDLLDDEQYLVAGVIDTTTNFIEHPEVVVERLERVAAIVGDPRRVLAGTDCGFETIAGKGRVAADVAWAKLAALSEGAALASARLL